MNNINKLFKKIIKLNKKLKKKNKQINNLNHAKLSARAKVTLREILSY